MCKMQQAIVRDQLVPPYRADETQRLHSFILRKAIFKKGNACTVRTKECRISANIKPKSAQHNYSKMTSNGLVLSTLYPTLYYEYPLPNAPFSMPKVANFLRFVLALFDLNSRRH